MVVTRLLQLRNPFSATEQLPVYDIANADMIFSFGANFLETWQSPVSYSRAFGEFRQGQSGGRGFFCAIRTTTFCYCRFCR